MIGASHQVEAERVREAGNLVFMMYVKGRLAGRGNEEDIANPEIVKLS